MAHRLKKQLIERLAPAKVVKSQLHRRTYQQFAERLGFVYFGFVDQRSDEHRLIRGLTVSAKHRDNHYCVGSYEGYDISLVERTDTIHFPGKAPKAQEWIIMTFDLHRQVDLPHIFAGLHDHGDTFYAQLFTKFSNFHPIQLNVHEGYPQEFLHKYSIYAQPVQALSASRLISPSIAQVISERFQGLTVEIHEGCLYVYAEHHRPNIALLDRMLTYGVWLARAIDQS